MVENVTKSVSAELEYAAYLDYLADRISFYFVVTLPTTALCFNLFALVVLFAKRSQKANSMVYLLKWQYVVDTIVIVNILFNFQKTALFSYSTLTLSDLACRLFYWWNRFLIHVSSWIQVCMSLDRFMNVFLLRRFRIRRDKAKISYLILAVIVALLVINTCNLGHYLDAVNSTLATNQTNLTLIMVCTASRELQLASDIISVLMRTLIPASVMAAIDVVLIRHVKKLKDRLFVCRSQKSEFHFTVSVVLINGAFFFLNFPLSVSLILQNVLINPSSSSSSSLSRVQTAEFNFYTTLASIFAFLFQTLEFFINMCLNRIFRKEILETLGFINNRSKIRVAAFQLTTSIRNINNNNYYNNNSNNNNLYANSLKK